MSRDELPNGNVANGKAGFGVQAYRWLVGGGVALLVLLSQRTLSTLDDTTAAVRSLQSQVAAMQGVSESRFSAHGQRLDSMDRRNDAQDVKIDGLWQRLWSIVPNTRAP
ncbi:hypothetical protein [Reyranella sp.]|uniref:hypothetical protein n=1 Tax=Reyranella sp. TaxID=1929291 RepID=UPI0040375873